MVKKCGIVFDLDGTLWDSSFQVGVAWNSVFSKHNVGIEVNESNMRVMMGRTVPEIGEAILGNIEPTQRKVILQECCNEENRLLRQYGGRLYGGVFETLESLSKSYTLFIVSNCETGYIEAFTDYHKTKPFITDVECAGGTGRNKAYNINLIVNRNGLDRAVYVGDTRHDMLAAAQAGTPFIHAAYGFDNGFEAENRIASIRQLPALVSKLFGGVCYE